MSASYQNKPTAKPTALCEVGGITKAEWTSVYFAAVELAERLIPHQDAFDVVHAAYLRHATTSPWNRLHGPFREHFLNLVGNECKEWRRLRDVARHERKQERKVVDHYETTIIPFVSSVASPEGLMIAREEAEDEDAEAIEQRALLRLLVRRVAKDPVAVQLLAYWAQHGGPGKPLTKIAAAIGHSITDVYNAKALIERQAHRIIVKKQGEDQ